MVTARRPDDLFY